MIKRDKIVEELRKILSKDQVIDDEYIIKLYARDAVYLEGNALAIVFPEKTEDVSKIVRFAYRNDIKIYPQGSASEIVGSSIPRDDGIIVNFSRMNRIKEYNIVDMYAVVEPGVRIIELNTVLAKEGYVFPIDPASVKTATIGGAINTGAGGMMGLRYGTMKDAVLGLEIVLPDENGTILKLGGKVTKYRVGYDLIRLIIGSEGTLALVTEATLRIVPLPRYIVSVAGFFSKLEDLVRTVIDLKKNRYNLYIAEFVDAQTVEIVTKYISSKIVGSGNLLIVSIDLTDETSVDNMLNSLEEIMRANNASIIYKARSLREAEELGLFDIRRAYYPTTIRMAAESRRDATKRIFVYIEDYSVPPSRLVEYITRLRELASKYNVNVMLGGHIGDGNIHPVIWYEEGDRDAEERIHKFLHDLAILTLELEGTVSSEHGIGIKKKKEFMMELEYKQSTKALELMKKIKQIFDPKNILNPGKIW